MFYMPGITNLREILFSPLYFSLLSTASPLPFSVSIFYFLILFFSLVNIQRANPFRSIHFQYFPLSIPSSLYLLVVYIDDTSHFTIIKRVPT